MKKVVIGLGVVIAAILVVAGLSLKAWAGIRRAQQHAIIGVLDEMRAARVEHLRFRDGRVIEIDPGDRRYSLRIYAQHLSQISTAECPEPFQAEWLNYVQALERFTAPFAGLGSMTEFAVSVAKPNGAAARDALDRLDKMNPSEAWMRVQVVALKYGVQIH